MIRAVNLFARASKQQPAVNAVHRLWSTATPSMTRLYASSAPASVENEIRPRRNNYRGAASSSGQEEARQPSTIDELHEVVRGRNYASILSVYRRLPNHDGMRLEDWEVVIQASAAIAGNTVREKGDSVRARFTQDVQEMQQALQKKGEPMTNHLYGALFQGYGDLLMKDQVVELFEQVRESKVLFNDYKLLFRISSSLSRCLLPQGLELLEELWKQGRCNRSSTFLRVYLDNVETIILRGIPSSSSSSTAETPEGAVQDEEKILQLINLEFLTEITTALRPIVEKDRDNRVDTQLMFIYGMKGDTQKSMQYLNDLMSRGQNGKVAHVVYFRLIQMGILRKNHDLVIQSFDELLQHHGESQLHSLEKIAVKVLESCLTTGKLDKAVNAVQMIQKAVQISPRSEYVARAIYPEAARLLEGQTDPSLVRAREEFQAKINDLAGAAVAGAAERELLFAARDGKVDEAMERLREFINKGGKNMRHHVADEAYRLFERRNIHEGMALVAYHANSASTVMSFTKKLLDEGKASDAWPYVRKWSQDTTFIGKVVFFQDLVQTFASSGQPGWAEAVLDAFEKRVPLSTWKPPFSATFYVSIFQGLVRYGDMNRSLALYERMIQPTNPVLPLPTRQVYHHLLLTAAFGGNLSAFETIYGKMREQTGVERRINETPDPMDVKAIQEAYHRQYQAYQDQLREAYAKKVKPSHPTEKKKPGSPSSSATYPVLTVEDIVIPQGHGVFRSTENIRMMAYTVNNAPEKALASLKDSLDPALKIAAVDGNTYQMIGSALMHQQKYKDFSGREAYSKMGRAIETAWGGKEVNVDNVDELLKQANSVVEEQLTEWTR